VEAAAAVAVVVVVAAAVEVVEVAQAASAGIQLLHLQAGAVVEGPPNCGELKNDINAIKEN
jgi:hypothetical protein